MKFDKQIELLGKEYLTTEMVGGVQMKFSGNTNQQQNPNQTNNQQQNPNQTNNQQQNPNQTNNQQQNPNQTNNQQQGKNGNPPVDVAALLAKAAESDGPDGADELDEYVKSLGLDTKRLGATFGELTARYLNNT